MTDKADNGVDWAIKFLAQVDTADEVWFVLKSSARAAVNADGATVVMLEGDYCYYVDEDAMSPLWKGQRFPVASCISGWAMLNGKTAVVPDIRVDDRIPLDAYRPTFVHSLAMVPIMADGPIGAIGAIGAYWARLHHASREEVAALERLATAAARALVRVERRAQVPTAAPGRA